MFQALCRSALSLSAVFFFLTLNTKTQAQPAALNADIKILLEKVARFEHRDAAARSLKDIKDPKTVETLIDIVEDDKREKETRMKALIALQYIDRTRFDARMQAAIADALLGKFLTN